MTSIGPAACSVPSCCRAPAASPRSCTSRARAAKARKEVLVYRTDVRPARARLRHAGRARRRRDELGVGRNGRRPPRRRRARTSSSCSARDTAGNIGSSVPLPPRSQYGRPLPGRGGITVRYLRAQAPSTPVTAGEHGERRRRVGGRALQLDAAPRRLERDPHARQRHALARSCASGRPAASRASTSSRSTRARATPRRRSSCSRSSSSDVLVVLPATTWQGLNPVDDDGDGRPDTLADGLPVRLDQPYVKDGLPPQIRRHEALLLAQLDRKGRRYDLTTDVALARGEGPPLAGHRGVIIAGDARWLDAGVARALRSFVRGGGRLLSVGTSLAAAQRHADARRARDRADAADAARPVRRAPAAGRPACGAGDRRQRASTGSTCSPAPAGQFGGVGGVRADARRARRLGARSRRPRRRRTAAAR